MVSIKYFEDGNRQVLVFEGMPAVNVEAIVRDITAKIATGEYSVEKVEDSNAMPLPEEKEPEIKIPTTFQDGPYKGMEPIQLIEGEAEEVEAAVTYLVEQKGDINHILYQDIENALVKYMNNKLLNCVPEEYAQKLTAAQIGKWYSYFKNLIPLYVWNKLLEKFEYTTGSSSIELFLSSAPEETLRSGIKYLITTCRNI